ncbi:SGNH/GDSL hydrolase family protein [Acinetobacter seifertii]|nr:SGNH/GDSL hydrolase family protein [Acinetobacter seifertii]
MVPDTRLQYPLSKNPDLVVVGFGMNDFGNSVLYSNLVKIVNTFKNAGSDVVLMPVIRTPTLPLVNYQGEDWRKVNRFVILQLLIVVLHIVQSTGTLMMLTTEVWGLTSSIFVLKICLIIQVLMSIPSTEKF